MCERSRAQAYTIIITFLRMLDLESSRGNVQAANDVACKETKARGLQAFDACHNNAVSSFLWSSTVSMARSGFRAYRQSVASW